MDIVLVIIILLIVFGGGWGYYNSRGPAPGYGGGWGVPGILITILVIVLIVWLLRGRI